MDSKLLGALELFGFKQITHPTRAKFEYKDLYNYGEPFSRDCSFKSTPMIIFINEPCTNPAYPRPYDSFSHPCQPHFLQFLQQ